VLGGVELGLLAGSIVTGTLLGSWQQTDHTFVERDASGMVVHDYRHDHDIVAPINIACFTAVIAVAVYGIVDAFVVGARRHERERQIEARLGF
jgi:hypothetical protein